MNNDQHPLLGALGLCRKAGKLLHREESLVQTAQAMRESCAPRRSVRTAGCWNGGIPMRRSSRATDIFPICTACIREGRSRRIHLRNLKRPAKRWRPGLPPAAGIPAGAVRGSSACGPVYGMAKKSHENIRALLSQSTFPNLMDSHPWKDGATFQIDGNLGAVAAFAELLAYSNGQKVQLLPALPEEWSEGEVDGLRLRGNLLLCMKWKTADSAGRT